MSRFLDTKVGKVVAIIVAFLLVAAVLGGLVALTGNLSVKGSSSKPATTTVSKTFSSSGSSSGASSGTSSGSGSSGTGSSSSSSTPVQYILTYLPGEYYDVESHCPEPVTVNSGEVVYINFDTHPTRFGYDFVGWATSDGADNPDYEDMAGYRTITMSSNVTLYPVFHVSDGPSGEGGGMSSEIESVSITIDNTSGSDVVIMDTDEKDELFTVSTGSSLTYTGYTGDGIRIRIACSCSSSLSGTYKGISSYLNDSLSSTSYDGYDWIYEPTSGAQSLSWYPESNDSFTISVTTK